MRSEKVDTRFWVGSAILHGALILVLVYALTGDKIFRKEERKLKPEIIRKDEELAEVIDQIRDLAVDRLQSQLALLQAGQERMEDNFHTLNAHYQPFLESQVETAQIRLEQEGAKTFARMEELQAAIDRAVLEKENASDAMWRVFDKNRAHILAGQEEIRRAILVAAPDQTDLIQGQDQVDANQMEAFRLISSSVSAQNGLWGDAKRGAQLQESIPKLIEDVRRIDEDIKQLQDKLPELEKSADAAQATLEGKLKDPTAEEKTITTAQKNLRRAKQSLEAVAKRLPRRQSQRTQVAVRLAKYETELQSINSRPEELRQTRDNSAEQASQLQAKVLEDQRTVYQGLLAHLKATADQAREGPTDAEDKAQAPSTTTEAK